MIEIKLDQNVDIKGSTLIEGFPGIGLVGPMAISYIIDKLKMRQVGHIESPDFPPLIAIHSDKPMSPIRLYYNDKHKLFTILAEFAIPAELTYEISKTIFLFCKTNGVSRIVSIGGIPLQKPPAQQGVPIQPAQVSNDVFAIASNDEMKNEAMKVGLKPVGEGVATGVSALIMLEAVNDGIPAISLLVQVDPNMLDPKYAELAIVGLNKLINLGVDVNELDREAREVEAKIKELLKRNRDVQTVHKKAVEDSAGPSMYA